VHGRCDWLESETSFLLLALFLLRKSQENLCFDRWETLSYTRCTYNKRPATPGALCPLDSSSSLPHRSASLFCLCPVSLSLFLPTIVCQYLPTRSTRFKTKNAFRSTILATHHFVILQCQNDGNYVSYFSFSISLQYNFNTSLPRFSFELLTVLYLIG